MYKKILAGIIMFFSVMVLCSVCAGAEYYEGYEYYVNNDGKTCTIDKYIGDDSNVKIPSKIDGKKVTVIGERAFQLCRSLNSVTIPKSVTFIDAFAFADCTSLNSVTIPNSVISIGEDAFNNTKIVNDSKDDLVYIGKWLVECKNKDITSVKIKSGTVGIADCAFYDCTSLKSVTIPKGVKSIGFGAFYGCTSLKSITIPKGVKSIENCAFYDCTSLKSVTIPKGVKSIGAEAFYGCTSLKSITIPKGVTLIGCKAFINCTSLNSVTIPSSVTSIGEDAFFNTKIVNDSKKDLVYIGKWLVECKNDDKTSAKIKSGTVGIANCAFYDCTSLKSVTIPKSVKSIGDSAFYWCRSLKSVTIPSSVISIGTKAFYNTKIVNDSKDDLVYIGKWLIECKNKDLTSAKIKSGTVGIAGSAFVKCDRLKSVTIPKGVTSIGEKAFKYCTSLNDVYYKGSKTSWKKISIGDDNDILNSAKIHYNSK